MSAQIRLRWTRFAGLVVLTTVGAAVALFAVAEIQDRWHRASEVARTREMEARSIGPDNPPSPESFYPMEVVPRPPVVRGFEVLTADEADQQIDDDELVLAVEIDGEPRAYPINMMHGPEREVFNDELAGRSIAATW